MMTLQLTSQQKAVVQVSETSAKRSLEKDDVIQSLIQRIEALEKALMISEGTATIDKKIDSNYTSIVEEEYDY